MTPWVFQVSDACVLLVLRSSKQYDDTLGVPGGNVDEGESLSEASLRETVEELGCLPDTYNVQGSILTKRGKNDGKHYTVFVANITSTSRDAWMGKMKMNPEHSAAAWLPLTSLYSATDGQVVAELRNASNLTAVISKGRKELHPVVKKLFSKKR
eukprot:gene29087-32298_t